MTLKLGGRLPHVATLQMRARPGRLPPHQATVHRQNTPGMASIAPGLLAAQRATPIAASLQEEKHVAPMEVSDAAMFLAKLKAKKARTYAESCVVNGQLILEHKTKAGEWLAYSNCAHTGLEPQDGQRYFFRAMDGPEFEGLLADNQLPIDKEAHQGIAKVQDYAKSYLDGRKDKYAFLVEFQVHFLYNLVDELKKVNVGDKGEGGGSYGLGGKATPAKPSQEDRQGGALFNAYLKSGTIKWSLIGCRIATEK